jgi:DNA polymerase-3 subunit gamma/tau
MVHRSEIYTVVARRYRPQQFAELIGQEHVAGALVNALQAGRIAHAYLFTGARGVGKTSAARILAKALNCENSPRPTPTPCDRCSSCHAIAAGDDVDVLEIDGASNNKVEEIRDLRQAVGFRPTRSRYRIYIIDEVHMLTTSAFNALLKTLEEPPEHVKFILATTEVQKIPITILSRCQRFDFAHIRAQKIYEQLQRIVQNEGLSAEDEALRLIARRAGGSLRDSQSLLDQLLASARGHLTAEHVTAVLGTATDDRIIELAQAILEADAKTALERIAAWVERGLQPGELLDQLIDYWRSLMLISCGGPEIRELPVSPNQYAALVQQVEKISLDAILAGLEVLTATKARTRGSSHTLVLLEMAVVRLTRLADLLPVSQLVQTLVQGKATAGPVVTPVGTAIKKKAELNPKSLSNGDLGQKSVVEKPSATTAEKLWSQLIPLIQTKSPLLAKSLSSASSYAIFGPNTLVIRFPLAYTTQREVCALESNIQRIVDSLHHLTGKAWTVRLETDTSVPDEPAATSNAPVAAIADRKKALMGLPLFKKASEALGAQIWHVDEDFNPASRPAQSPNDQPPTPTDED